MQSLAALSIPDVYEKMPLGIAYCRVVYEGTRPTDFQFLYTNPAFGQVSRLGPVVGKRVTEIGPGLMEPGPWLIELCGRVATTGASEDGERFFSALQRWFSVYVFCPQPGYFIAMFNPVTRSDSAQVGWPYPEKRAQAIVDASPVPTAVNDRHGNITYLNVAFTRTFGYASEELRTLEEWWPKAYPDPDYRTWVSTRWQAHLEQSRSSGDPFVPIEVRLRCKSGDFKTVMASATPLDGSNPDSGLYLVTLFDVSDRIELERIAKEREETLQRAQSVAKIGSFAMAGDTETYTISKETARLFDLGDSGVTKFGEWFSRVHPDDQAVVETAWRKALQGAPYDQIYRIVVRGQVIWIRALAELTFDEHGHLRNAVGTVQDISDLKRSEDEQRKLLEIINRSPDVIASATVDRKLTFINPAGREYLGLSEGASYPENPIEHAHPEWAYRKVIDEGIPAALEHGAWVGETAVRRHATGEEVPVSQLIIAHKDSQGQPYLLSTIMRDISGEIRQRRRIAEQAGLLDTVIDHASIGIGMGSNRVINILNPAFHHMFGYEDGELLGKSTRVLYPSDEVFAFVGKQMADAFASGRTANIEAKGIRKNGEAITFRFLVKALEPGNPDSAVVCIAEDVTERRLLEEQLLQQKDELDDLYNRAPCGYHSLDADGTIQRINDTELDWLGYSREEVVGKRRITDFFTEKSVETFKANFPKFLAHGKIDDLELELVSSTGSVRPVLVSGTAIRGKDGQLLRSRSVVVDYGNIRDERESLRRVLAVAPMAVRIARLADNRVVFVNAAYCAWNGRSESEAMGLDVAQFYVDQNVYPEIRRRLSIGETITNQLVELHLPNDPEVPHIWALASFIVIDYMGEPCVLAWLFDISDRELLRRQIEGQRDRLEAQVAQRVRDLEIAKESAESANRAKTSFLSMASHELRTPMNGVMGMIGIARRRTADPQVSEFLAKAERSSQRLLDIINDVLDMSRIEADKLTLASTAFTLAQIMGPVRDATDTQAKTKGLRLSIDVAEDLVDAAFVGDPTRLTQILINMVGNAVKFTAAGSVHVDVREVVSGQNAIMLRFEVRDTGIGVQPEDRDRIFEPFTQVDSSSTRQFGGTGLGLALCKRLVVAMQGRIGVHSRPGDGSTFWFEIPAQRVHIGTSDSKSDGSAYEARLRAEYSGTAILVVEDDPINQEVFRVLLESAGMYVLTAADGRQAVEMARAARFRLILMDMKMPNMNGVDATREIRKLPSYAKTPIIAVTANAFFEDRDECIRAGMTDHVSKPITAETLYWTILRWLWRG